MSNNSEFENEKRISCEGGFGIMPHRLRRAENININAKFLFLALIELQHEKGYCYASNKYLASQELNGVSVRSIQNWLNELEENGWIKTEIIRGDKNEVIQRRIYTNLNQNTPINPTVNTHSENFFMTPHESTFMTPHESTFTYKKNNIEKEEKENIKRKADPMNENPASGSPSSPNVDESQTYDSIFESFWDKVQYKAQKANAYAQWKKLTNNSKSQKTIKEVEEGYERYVSFLAKERARGFKDRQHMEMSRFLNPKNLLWKENWKTEQEQRQEQQQVQTENQKYLEEHENKTSFRQYKKVEEPKNWKERIGIAGKLGLLNKFSREEIRELFDITEWKFVPADIKQVIASKEIERIVSENEEKTNKLFYEYNCFSMMGKLGYLRARDVYNEETGKELEYALESYAPDQDNYDKNVWGWLVQYGLSFGKPNLENPTVPKSWIKENPGRRCPITNFLIYV